MITSFDLGYTSPSWIEISHIFPSTAPSASQTSFSRSCEKYINICSGGTLVLSIPFGMKAIILLTTRKSSVYLASGGKNGAQKRGQIRITGLAPFLRNYLKDLVVRMDLAVNLNPHCIAGLCFRNACMFNLD